MKGTAGAKGAKGMARGPLWVRVMLVMLAVASLAAAGAAVVNLSAAARYNEATATLRANIKLAGQDDADLTTLEASQQQTDDQFGQSGPLDVLLLPGLKASLDTNREISRQLTQRISQELAAQRGQTDGSSDTSVSPQDTKGTANSEDSPKKGGALTENQKRQVEELLKANQQSTPAPETTTQQQPAEGNRTQTTKPW